MKETVTLFTAEPVHLFFVVTEPDEREPDKYVLSTHVLKNLVEGHRIARRAVTLEESGELTVLSHEPRSLMYVGWHDDPGLQAQLFALTPDESEAWKTAQTMEAHFLGTVVRAKEFMVHPASLYDECIDHFQAILHGKTIEPVDQLLARRLA